MSYLPKANKMNIQTFQHLPPIQQLAFFLCSFVPAELNLKCFTTILARHFKDATETVVKGVLADLVTKGFLVADDGIYFVNDRSSMPVLEEIARTGCDKNWPLDLKDCQALFLSSGGRLGSYEEMEAKVIWASHLLVLQYAAGFDPSPDISFLKAFKRAPNIISRTAAAWIVESTHDEPNWQHVTANPHGPGIWQQYLNYAFITGHDVRQTLAAIAEADDLSKCSGLLLNYLALCVWTGWKDGLEKPFVRKSVGAPLLARFQAIFAGNFALADKAFRIDAIPFATDLGTLPMRFLLMVIAIAASPEKPPKTRIVHMVDANDEDEELLNFPELLYDANDEILALLQHWSNDWYRVLAGKGELVSRVQNPTLDFPLLHLLAAWDYHFSSHRRSDLDAHAQKLANILPVLSEHGYLNLAGLFLSLLVGDHDESNCSALFQEMNARGLWLLPYQPPAPKWKSILAEFKKLVVQHDRAQKRQATAQRLQPAWYLELEHTGKPSFETFAVHGIELYVRDPGTPSDIGKPVKLDDINRNRSTVKSCFSDKDFVLAKTLLASDSYSYYSNRLPMDALELLVGMDNLFVAVYEWRYNRYAPIGTPKPITIDKGGCTLETRLGEDGGLTLGLPFWIGEQNTPIFLRKINDSHYSLITLTPEVRKFMEVFKTYGGGRLAVDIPREGVESSNDIIEGITRLIPLAKPSDDQKSLLPRRAADHDLAVRLDYANGVLTARAVVRPIKGNPALIFEPGHGTSERLATGTLGPYLLIRDLNAERAAFAPLQNVLSPFESFYDGTATWTLDELPAALGALTAIKSLEPPVALEWIDDQRLNVTYAPKSGIALTSSRTAEDWLAVKGSFTLDNGRVLSIAQLLEAMASREGQYVRLSDGDFLALSQTMLRELETLRSASRRKGDGVEVARAALPMIEDAFAADEKHEAIPLPSELAKSAEEIRRALAKRPRIPTTLNAELREYQKDGYRWLSRLAACGFGACLADDMGLGKTLQIITLLLERADDGPSLVIAPSSVCGNWRREILRFAPALQPVFIPEAPDAPAAAAPHQVFIASYGYLLFHEEEFKRVAWNGLVLDEAQAIKNDASRRAHVVKRFRAKFRLAATGTPIENRLGDLWSIFDFLNPGLLGPAASFLARLAPDGKASCALKRLVKPLILRRLKGDVLDDLPAKTEVTLPIELGPDERSAYEGCRLHALATLNADAGDKEQNRISILAELTRLRRFCCHPSLVLGADAAVPSAKMEALVELLEHLRQGHHRALVFSQFTDYLEIVRRVLDQHAWNYKYLDGTTPTLERERLVNAFQNGDGDFFLISLKAGGTGLNLTAANYVILLDPWWNPAVENQAADRAHRIGQTQPVTIYRLVAADTVEERVIELHQEKSALAADVLDGTSTTRFSPDDLLNLFK